MHPIPPVKFRLAGSLALIRLKFLFLKNSNPTIQQSVAARSAVNNEQDAHFSRIVRIVPNNPTIRGNLGLDHTTNGQNNEKAGVSLSPNGYG